jgi:ribonuclease Z
LFSESLKGTFGGELPDTAYPADDCLHPDELQGVTITEGMNGMWEICREGNLSVQAAPLKHRTVCFGYVIKEDQIPGRLAPAFLKKKGIPPGPSYARIKQGESIVAPDGSVITPGEVI